MGSFDTVVVGEREGQVKCFGKGYRVLRPGDAVTLYYVPSIHDYAEPNPFGSLDDPEAQEVAFSGSLQAVFDYQIIMSLGGYLTVRGGVLVGWVDERDESVPVFNRYGRPHPSDSYK